MLTYAYTHDRERGCCYNNPVVEKMATEQEEASSPPDGILYELLQPAEWALDPESVRNPLQTLFPRLSFSQFVGLCV